MFYKYLLISDEGNKVLYLYVDNNFEFGSMDYKKDKDNIYLKVKKYMERMGISFSGNKVCFVKNGIIIGMIDISDYDFSYNRLVEIIDANSSDKLIKVLSMKLGLLDGKFYSDIEISIILEISLQEVEGYKEMLRGLVKELQISNNHLKRSLK